MNRVINESNKQESIFKDWVSLSGWCKLNLTRWLVIGQLSEFSIEWISKPPQRVLLSILYLLVDVRHSRVVFLRRLLPLFCHFIQRMIIRKDRSVGWNTWTEHLGKFSSQQLFLHCPTFSIIGLASSYYYHFFLSRIFLVVLCCIYLYLTILLWKIFIWNPFLSF